MECSTSYGSMRSSMFHSETAYRLPTTRPKLLRKERRASNMLRRAVVRAMSGEFNLPHIGGH